MAAPLPRARQSRARGWPATESLADSARRERQHRCRPPVFTTTTTAGYDHGRHFYWTGKGLNWDVFAIPVAGRHEYRRKFDCVPDANGYYTSAPLAPNYYDGA